MSWHTSTQKGKSPKTGRSPKPKTGFDVFWDEQMGDLQLDGFKIRSRKDAYPAASGKWQVFFFLICIDVKF